MSTKLNNEVGALNSIMKPFMKELSDMRQATKDKLYTLVEQYSAKIDECKELSNVSIALKIQLWAIVDAYQATTK